ncbi:MAG: hypothetical protein ACK56F_24830 [bacterium]
MDYMMFSLYISIPNFLLNGNDIGGNNAWDNDSGNIELHWVGWFWVELVDRLRNSRH